VSKEQLRPREGIAKMVAVEKDHAHTVSISIRELNKNVLEKETLERASPGSNKYGKWLKKEEINALLLNAEGTRIVKEWLAPYEGKIEVVKERTNSLDVSAPVSVWEELLGAHFFWYEGDGHKVCRSEEYSLPAAVGAEVNAVRGVTDLPMKIHTGPIRAPGGPRRAGGGSSTSGGGGGGAGGGGSSSNGGSGGAASGMARHHIVINGQLQGMANQAAQASQAAQAQAAATATAAQQGKGTDGKGAAADGK
jgi:uncharacterized membrane protein YgcG